MRQFRGVIFDMDGLLLDTERIALAAFNRTCAGFNLPCREDLFMLCLGTNQARGREVLQEGLRGLVDHSLFEETWDRHYLELTTNEAVPLKPGASELLEHVASLRIPAAVATSTRTSRARDKLRSAGILEKFEAIVGGDQVEKSKPAPDIYLRAAEVLNAEPRACLALEDSENGVRAALAAGMTVVQIPDLVAPSQALRSLGHVVLQSLRDVPAYRFSYTG